MVFTPSVSSNYFLYWFIQTTSANDKKRPAPTIKKFSTDPPHNFFIQHTASINTTTSDTSRSPPKTRPRRPVPPGTPRYSPPSEPSSPPPLTHRVRGADVVIPPGHRRSRPTAESAWRDASVAIATEQGVLPLVRRAAIVADSSRPIDSRCPVVNTTISQKSLTLPGTRSRNCASRSYSIGHLDRPTPRRDRHDFPPFPRDQESAGPQRDTARMIT